MVVVGFELDWWMERIGRMEGIYILPIDIKYLFRYNISDADENRERSGSTGFLFVLR